MPAPRRKSSAKSHTKRTKWKLNLNTSIHSLAATVVPEPEVCVGDLLARIDSCGLDSLGDDDVNRLFLVSFFFFL
jgi:hypothetical protein